MDTMECHERQTVKKLHRRSMAVVATCVNMSLTTKGNKSIFVMTLFRGYTYTTALFIFPYILSLVIYPVAVDRETMVDMTFFLTFPPKKEKIKGTQNDTTGMSLLTFYFYFCRFPFGKSRGPPFTVNACTIRRKSNKKRKTHGKFHSLG